jgi:hypothetical protein
MELRELLAGAEVVEIVGDPQIEITGLALGRCDVLVAM